MACYRTDVGNISRYRVTKEGYLDSIWRIAKVGEYPYLNADGSERIEIVTPEELFKKDSYDTFKGIPLTDGHPPERVVGGKNGNFEKYSKGLSLSSVWGDGDFLNVATRLTDADSVERVLDAIERGKPPQVSCGYDCNPELVADGKYIQRDRIGNHIAFLVDGLGRHGPDVCVGFTRADDVWSVATQRPPGWVTTAAGIAIPDPQLDASTEVQSLLLPTKDFTPAQAKKWAKTRKFNNSKVDSTDDYHRLRQFDPEECSGEPRTIDFGDSGIKAVVCVRKSKTDSKEVIRMSKGVDIGGTVFAIDDDELRSAIASFKADAAKTTDADKATIADLKKQVADLQKQLDEYKAEEADEDEDEPNTDALSKELTTAKTLLDAKTKEADELKTKLDAMPSIGEVIDTWETVRDELQPQLAAGKLDLDTINVETMQRVWVSARNPGISNFDSLDLKTAFQLTKSQPKVQRTDAAKVQGDALNAVVPPAGEERTDLAEKRRQKRRLLGAS